MEKSKGMNIETVIKEEFRIIDWGANRLGKILNETREKLWNDVNFRNEQEYVKKRIEKDSNYLEKAMKKIDLIYKDRAQQRFCNFRRCYHQCKHSEFDDEGQYLIPEWGRPPPIAEESVEDLSICPSPTIICDFETKTKMENEKSTIFEKQFTDETQLFKREVQFKPRPRTTSQTRKRSRSSSSEIESVKRTRSTPKQKYLSRRGFEPRMKSRSRTRSISNSRSSSETRFTDKRKYISRRRSSWEKKSTMKKKYRLGKRSKSRTKSRSRSNSRTRTKSKSETRSSSEKRFTTREKHRSKTRSSPERKSVTRRKFSVKRRSRSRSRSRTRTQSRTGSSSVFGNTSNK